MNDIAYCKLIELFLFSGLPQNSENLKKRYPTNFDFVKFLKSKTSANIYGPSSMVFFDGLTMSVKITLSRPYLLRNKCAKSGPNCPKPPENVDLKKN